MKAMNTTAGHPLRSRSGPTARRSGRTFRHPTLFRLAWAVLWCAGCARSGTGVVSSEELIKSFLSDWAKAADAVDPGTGFPRRVVRAADGMTMILIPAGTFKMGAVAGDSHAGHDEKPQRLVMLSKAYYIDEHEVTESMWHRFCTEVDEAHSTTMAGSRHGTSYHSPINGVSWHAAMEYAAWAQVSLPTEAQWERAARGGKEDLLYPWGNEDDVGMRNGPYQFDNQTRFDLDGFMYDAPVKSFPPNTFGLFDICGNVWEWCSDLYQEDYYRTGPSVDPTGPLEPPMPKPFRVVRGGGAGSSPRRELRVSQRRYAHEQSRMFGFRCAITLP